MDNKSKSKRESVGDFMARRRNELKSKLTMVSIDANTEQVVYDDYERISACKSLIKKATGIVYDDKMTLHKCEWDESYPENPDRYKSVMNRCIELNLIERCKKVEYEPIELSDFLNVHTREHFEKLKIISNSKTLEDMERNSSHYDAIYFNDETFNSAYIAASSAVSLVKEICLDKIQNGMAIIRPPGHHAMKNDYCGYCFCNNVAMAASYALEKNYVEKILIVDVDVHHGQGTQQLFYDDKRVLYFSIHRFENGTFWPNLPESNVDYIGERGGAAEGYNINFPLNETGLTDDDYLSIVYNILLPVAYEYQPQLIIISAGYDACIGCPEGEMNVTPGFYGHLVTLLSGLASAKIAVCLEGGYFLPSLSEGVAMTLRALLGDPPALLAPTVRPRDSVIETIADLKYYLHPFWNCLKRFYDVDDFPLPIPELIFEGGQQTGPPYPTRECYPVNSKVAYEKFTSIINDLRKEYKKLGANQRVAYCYDDDMLLHECNEDKYHVERPERLEAVYRLFKDWHLDERCIAVPPREVDVSLARQVHKEPYVSKLFSHDFASLANGKSCDIYHSKYSLQSIVKSSGCLISVADSVLRGECASGIALIRPPGHHAEESRALGFCHLNNVSIAAKYILDRYHKTRIMIIDFDVHHGNGTQQIFYDTDKVLYVSIHRYENGTFYPSTTDGASENVGEGAGRGFNVNIPLNQAKVGNTEYFTIFQKIILPIAYSYAPEVVLVSAGFDAGINDPLGRYNVTPDAFGHLVQMLKPFASGALILALEGGYNIQTLKYSSNICVKTLLGDPLPEMDGPKDLHASFVRDVKNVIAAQMPYWPALSLCVRKM